MKLCLEHRILGSKQKKGMRIKMIDFHTHILPNVDDGAKSIEETIKLIKEARIAGFSTIVLTSHYMENYYEVNVEERTKLLNFVRSNLQEKGIDINLVLGNEIYITDKLSELVKKNEACSINNTRYVLFELPFNMKPINLYDIIYNMLQNKLVPILAHPERYSFVQQNPSIINDLIEKGVLMQSNYGSFIGQYGKKAKIIVKKLLENDMVHILGTDVHKANTIYPKIPQILSSLEKLIGEERLELITKTNPELIIENKEIEVYNPRKIKLSLIEKMIMK